ncbi:MAG TPA: class I SAM-dependent methyltransferase [Candidatus Paceibacterota bacterium]|nr:class I SAM-dependent methyltransferase [Verrucomicrobiota bacterium]HRY49735.1 class I SAM-dependent methyltransferase [Candidatus Paceibacterota bacterium]HSA02443.1 class I SAM-dependent methyltransferase [Candidatus Paceibacterota bacterium]
MAAHHSIRIAVGGGDTDKPLSLQKRLRLLQDHMTLSGAKILDCGCGAGAYLLAFLELGADAYGIEYSVDKVSQYQSRGLHTDRVNQGDLEKIHYPSNTFDLALLNEVLEHVPDDGRALSEIFRVLKPGGYLALFSPNRLYPFETHGITLRCCRLKLPPCFPFIPYVPLAIGRRLFDFHARNYFGQDLCRLLDQAGFQVRYRTWLWQTFENISGQQPAIIRWLRPIFRGIANCLERCPGLRRFGVSQVLLCQKP